MNFKKFIHKVFFYLDVRIEKFFNYIFQMTEIIRIKKFLKSQNTNTLLAIWDLKTNGVAVGDFIIFCFFLKYFQLKGKKINLCIIYEKNQVRKTEKKIPKNIIKNY